MPPKSTKVELVDQWLNENFGTDLDARPSRILRWFTNNFIGRSISYMFAWTYANVPVRLRATSGGILLTQPLPVSGFTDYATTNQNDATGAGWETLGYTETSYRADILVENADMEISFKKENGNWGDTIYLPIGAHEYDMTFTDFRFRPLVATETTTLSLVTLR